MYIPIYSVLGTGRYAPHAGRAPVQLLARPARRLHDYIVLATQTVLIDSGLVPTSPPTIDNPVQWAMLGGCDQEQAPATCRLHGIRIGLR